MRIWLEVLWMWGVGGLQVHKIWSRKLLYKEVVKVQSNCKKSYFWWLGNPTRDDLTGSNQIGKDQGGVSARLVWGKRREWECDLVRVELLQMIGLIVVMLMSISRVVSAVLVLWGVCPTIGNGYAGWHSRNLKLGIDSCRIAIITTYMWPSG